MKYITLVFKHETEEELEIVQSLARKNNCVAWSTAHEINRLELIEDALDCDDIDRAGEYISMIDPCARMSDIIDRKGEG